MLLHLNFCIEWFDSNSKEDSKSFENALKYLKRKKKRNFILSLAFRPVKPSSPPAQPQPTIASAACFSARGRSPLPRLGPSLASPARARAAAAVSFSWRVTDTVDPPVRAVFFFSMTRADFFPCFTDRISPSKFVPFLFSASPGYKNEVPHLSAPSYLEATNRSRPEEALLELQSEPSAIPSTAPSSGQLCLHLLPW
jgi:hypothetical protein